MQDQQFLLHSGFPNKASFMGTRQRLAMDDLVEITLEMSLQKFAVGASQVTGPAQKINAICFQFSNQATPTTLTFQSADYLELQGLVVFIINEDRATPEEPQNKPYFITYRYFPKRVKLMRDYFSLLIEGLSDLTSRHPTRGLPVAGAALQAALPNRLRVDPQTDPGLLPGQGRLPAHPDRPQHPELRRPPLQLLRRPHLPRQQVHLRRQPPQPRRRRKGPETGLNQRY